MTTRQQAMNWWNTQLSERLKDVLTDDYFFMRTPQSLTGREIEQIWTKELKIK